VSTNDTRGNDGFPEQRAVEIEFAGATKLYPGQQGPAISDLSLTIPAGAICCLVGPSGGGKTTAMKLVNRLIELSDGDITVGGQSVRTTDVITLRRGIGYVIQQVGLFPHMTIAANIATVPTILGWSKDRIRSRVDELLQLVRLDQSYARRYPGQLSGGQQQRIGLARALAVDPPVMLMDEPFGALDPITREQIQDEFLRLQERIGKTVIFVTHDIDEAIKMGDRIAVLREGGVLAQYGTAEELLAHPADDFVADFVGADRGLKRLALHTIGELLDSANTKQVAPPGIPSVNERTTLQIGLSVLVDTGADMLAVTDNDGHHRGTVSLQDMRTAVRANGTLERSRGEQ
jgi:osmoprotectant transport system ATP-binding protein